MQSSFKNLNHILNLIGIGMEPDRKYEFVAKESDVDYVRIVAETPENTPFIIIEERDRLYNKPKGWTLLVHNDVLSHPRAQNILLGGACRVHHPIHANWGSPSMENEGRAVSLLNYRAIGQQGKFPGYVKQQIEFVRMAINPKDTHVSVTYP